jgi:UrcA family protein
MKISLVAAALTVLGGTAAATPTVLKTPSVRAERVSFVDLDLSTEQGRIALETRIEAAAHRLCAGAARDCYAAAVSGARSQPRWSGFGNRDAALAPAVVVVVRPK